MVDKDFPYLMVRKRFLTHTPKMAQAKITAKGQVTIPLVVRRRLGVGPGDEIEFQETENGVLVTKRVPTSPFEKYVGYLKKKRGQNPDKIMEELRRV